jgi:hypothetical protein
MAGTIDSVCSAGGQHAKKYLWLQLATTMCMQNAERPEAFPAHLSMGLALGI